MQCKERVILNCFFALSLHLALAAPGSTAASIALLEEASPASGGVRTMNNQGSGGKWTQAWEWKWIHQVSNLAFRISIPVLHDSSIPFLPVG
jgi:hypothetical protein